MYYAIYSWWGGWNRLYQYPAERSYEMAQRHLAKAKDARPKAKLVIREVED